MPDEVTLPAEQGTEAATASEAPTDFREFAKWRATGELPAPKEPETPAAAEDTPPAKTEPDSGTDDSQDAGEDDDEPDDAPPAKGKGGSRQRRIERLTRENEELKRQLVGGQPPPKPQDKPSEPAAAADSGKPKLEDFQTLEAYQEALTDWKLDQRERSQKEAAAKTAAEDAVRTEQEKWAKKEKAAQKAHDDYDDVIDAVVIPAGPGVRAARQAILEDDHGAELLYYLGKNPKELARIAGLSPASAAMAIGRLSARFDTPPAPENGKPRITGAPKPPPPSGRPSKTTSDSIDDPEVLKDFPRWERLRKAQLGRS